MGETESFKVENGQPDMFSQFADLYNTVDTIDNHDHIDIDDWYFQSIYSSSGVDLFKDVVLVRNANGDLVASGTIFLHTSFHQAQITIQVHPDYRRHGLGSKVYEHLYQRGVNHKKSELVCRVFSFRSHSIAFTQKHGFQHSHSISKMRLEHANPAMPPLYPWGLTIRQLKIPKELNIWASLQNRLFRGMTGYSEETPHSLKKRTTYAGFDPGLIVVGEISNYPIALCLGWSFLPKRGDPDQKHLQIQGIGVLPEFQRMGYGSVLLQDVMNRGYIRGHTSTELLVMDTNHAAIEMYHKLGFEERYKHLWFVRKLDR